MVSISALKTVSQVVSTIIHVRQKDLIATVPAAAGSTFDKTITTNVGNVDSQGIEFSLNATPIKTKDLQTGYQFKYDMAENEG